MQLRHILLIVGGAVAALAIGVGVGTLARVPVDNALAGGAAAPVRQTTAEVMGAPAPPAPVLDIDPLSYSAEPPMVAIAPAKAAPVAPVAPVVAAPANAAATEVEPPPSQDDDGPREVSAPPPTAADAPG